MYAKSFGDNYIFLVMVLTKRQETGNHENIPSNNLCRNRN